jgi:hypothetical protein
LPSSRWPQPQSSQHADDASQHADDAAGAGGGTGTGLAAGGGGSAPASQAVVTTKKATFTINLLIGSTPADGRGRRGRQPLPHGKTAGLRLPRF